MLHFSRWKVTAILAAVLLAVVFALPNIMSPSQQEAVARFGMRPMTLGLDLQGGSNLLLEVDRKDMMAQLQQQLASDIRAGLRTAKIGYGGIQRVGTGVSVTITKPEDYSAARDELQKLVQPVSGGLFGGGQQTSLYVMKQDNGTFSFEVQDTGLQAKIAAALKQVIEIVKKRVDASGTTEAVVQQQGSDRIVLQLPGIGDPQKVLALVGKTGALKFQLVCADQPGASNQRPPLDCQSYPRKEDVDALIKAKAAKGDTTEPTADELAKLPQLWVQTGSRATVDGADLTDAQPSFDQNNRAVVTFRFNQKGAVRFGKLTAENVNKPFAIVLDGVVQSAPVINEPILGGSGQISGQFTTDETANLAVVLRSGALPAKLVVVEQRTVGPSLGSDSIRAGLIASVVGLGLVVVFMVIAYGLFGIFANLALLINLVMLIAIMSFMGFTLTLPGIAGIVLTMGMAVDSNVIIFERQREEWRNGRSAISSIETGFKTAFGTILDSNFTALIAAIVLLGVGSGPVRGFAIAHAIGILTTIFTAYTVTRLIVATWMRWAKPKEVPL
ncbi:protein translocase subunit SecD [Aestuariivirga sp.]|uniref:protein translocase subunit SecD n=1 Tax=Aestuariivirga sp. TaxID=2650926 RepID=UPI0039E3171C